MFDIQVTVHLKDGSVQRIPYYLSYDLPDDDGQNYAAVES
jgi:hypothetical protein